MVRDVTEATSGGNEAVGLKCCAEGEGCEELAISTMKWRFDKLILGEMSITESRMLGKTPNGDVTYV